MDASSLNYSDLLKPFQLLQLIIGGTVFLAICVVILKGRADNKKDAHIAPSGHDMSPMGITVMANQVVQLLATGNELLRSISQGLNHLYAEQTKTNSRLAELQAVHKSEMEHLRDTVDESKIALSLPPGANRRKPGNEG